MSAADVLSRHVEEMRCGVPTGPYQLPCGSAVYDDIHDPDSPRKHPYLHEYGQPVGTGTCVLCQEDLPCDAATMARALAESEKRVELGEAWAAA